MLFEFDRIALLHATSFFHDCCSVYGSASSRTSFSESDRYSSYLLENVSIQPLVPKVMLFENNMFLLVSRATFSAEILFKAPVVAKIA